MSQTTPRQHDEKTAALYFDLAKAQQQLQHAEASVMREAGYVQEYGTRRTGTWSTQWVDGTYSHRPLKTLDDGLANLGDNSPAFDRYGDAITNCQSIRSEIDALDADYTGWSRFFLVTSSQGHIHSSMNCSSCRMSTTYGWLPELSGDSEAEAVAAHGPALCTVCFPSAPVEDTGHKITQTRAQELAWSPDRQEKIRQREEREVKKAEAKARKEANRLKYAERIAPKINEMIDRFNYDRRQGNDYFAAEDEFGYQAVSAYEDITREHERQQRRVTA